MRATGGQEDRTVAGKEPKTERPGVSSNVPGAPPRCTGRYTARYPDPRDAASRDPSRSLMRWFTGGDRDARGWSPYSWNEAETKLCTFLIGRVWAPWLRR